MFYLYELRKRSKNMTEKIDNVCSYKVYNKVLLASLIDGFVGGSDFCKFAESELKRQVLEKVYF